MYPLGGYTGRLLRVDLTNHTARSEPLDTRLAELYLGGRGLGARLLYNEVGPQVAPLDPENKLFFLTGPLVGTLAPTSARYCVTTKSPQTGLYLYSICSGRLGPELKMAGYDGLIVEGRADQPTYLLIANEDVQFADATHLWGMDTFTTQEVLKRELASRGGGEFACIGPAGEHLSKMACIISERRAAGRGGPGAVMGSKNLKAIAVVGSQDVRVRDMPSFMRSVSEVWQRINATPFLRQALSRYGSAVSVGLTSEIGILPTRNWQTGVFEGEQGLLPKNFREKVVLKDLACPSCPIACSKLCRGTDGSISEGPEYETIYAFGSACGVGDIERVVQADMLCDKWGLDTISAGVTIAFAMECVQKGLLGSRQLQGIPIEFGRGEIFPALIRMMALREGIGDVLADGVEAARRRLNIKDDSFAMHAKGMELGGYDPRGLKGQALVFSTGPRGGCHHANGYVITLEAASGKWDRFALAGKGELVRQARNLRMIFDSATYCAFAGIAGGLETASLLLSPAIGQTFDVPSLLRLGERCSNIERAYNVRQGVRRAQDTLPARLLNEPMPEGPSKGQVVELEPLLDDFYGVCGWDVQTGVPTKERLESLDLHDIAVDLGSLPKGEVEGHRRPKEV